MSDTPLWRLADSFVGIARSFVRIATALERIADIEENATVGRPTEYPIKRGSDE